MSIIRVHKQSHFKTIDNRFLERTDMSGKAKAVLAYLVSRPDDWIVHVDHMINKCFKEGSDWIYSALKELEVLHYIQRARVRNPNGKLGGIEYAVFEIPQLPNVQESLINKDIQPIPENPEQVEKLPIPEKPEQVKPEQVKPEQAIYSNITKQEDNKEEQQQAKELSVCTFSKKDKKLGNVLTQPQIAKITEVCEGLANQLQIETLELVEQVKYALLDSSAFTKAGTDFEYKLNSIAKVIREGRWEIPKSFQAKEDKPVSSPNDEFIQKLKTQIRNLGLEAYSFEQAAKRFESMPDLVEAHIQNAKLHRIRLGELKNELKALTGSQA